MRLGAGRFVQRVRGCQPAGLQGVVLAVQLYQDLQIEGRRSEDIGCFWMRRREKEREMRHDMTGVFDGFFFFLLFFWRFGSYEMENMVWIDRRPNFEVIIFYYKV